MTDPSARIRLISDPVASPGHCAICGKNEHPEGFAYIDNFDFEFYGSVIFCADCGLTIGRVFGAASGDEVTDLKKRLHALTEESNNLRQYALTMEDTLDNLSILSDLRSRLSDSSDSDLSDVVGSDEANNESDSEVTTGADFAVGDTVSAGETADGESDEVSSEQGRSNVQRSDASLDELLGSIP